MDAGGPVENHRRGTFVVDVPVSGSPKSSIVMIRMDNRSQGMIRYVLTAD